MVQTSETTFENAKHPLAKAWVCLLSDTQIRLINEHSDKPWSESLIEAETEMRIKTFFDG